MNTRTLTALSLIAMSLAAGCAAPAQEEEGSATQDALTQRDLKKYGMSVGVVATGVQARALYEAIKASGGKSIDEHTVLAGLTSLELRLSAEGDADATEGFGVSCLAAEGDSTFHADTCSLYAIVEMSGQEQGRVQLTGKLASAVAQSLPRTSPEDLVGSTTTSSGPVSCTTIPGPAGSRCTVKALATTESLDALVNGPDAQLSASDAKKVVKAFFPGA